MPIVLVNDAKEAKLRLTELELKVKNLEPMWPKIGAIFSKAVGRQFATRGAYFGTPWKPLKPEYLAWKIANGWPRAILIQTGKMRSSFTGRPMFIEKYGSSSAQFGSDERKVKWHQFGTRKMAARPMLKSTAALRKDVRDEMASWIVGRG